MKTVLFCSALAAAFAWSGAALASLEWNWSYTAAGINATGTFTTDDTPDGSGFYLITGITGSRDGVAITGLQPAGTPIPGNEPYAVDDLVSPKGAQLTGNGFGFSLANGDYANPFYVPSEYREYLSVPPYTTGQGTEVPVSFTAAIVPEPDTASLAGLGIVGLVAACWRRGRGVDAGV
jgi:hypothetical protein